MTYAPAIKIALLDRSFGGQVYEVIRLMNSIGEDNLQHFERSLFDRVFRNLVRTQHSVSPHAAVAGVHVFMCIAGQYVSHSSVMYGIQAFTRAGNYEGAEILSEHLLRKEEPLRIAH